MTSPGPATHPAMIMVAPNGARVLKTDNPATPITPKEIAEEVAKCAKAGASIAHLHARNPDGSPTQSIKMFREITEGIRERCDVVIQISLGTRGFTVDQALEPVDLRPEMVSLPLEGYLTDDPKGAEDVRRMAAYIRERGVRPELSIYNQRMLDAALDLIKRDLVELPASFLIVAKDPKSFRDVVTQVMTISGAFPPDSNWWVAAGGRFGLELRALALSLGGHVRVGFEDTIRTFDQTRLAPSNAFLVEQIKNLADTLGRPVASAAQAKAAISRIAQPA